MTEQELAKLRDIYVDIGAGRKIAALAKIGHMIGRVEAEHRDNAAAYDALKAVGPEPFKP